MREFERIDRIIDKLKDLVSYYEVGNFYDMLIRIFGNQLTFYTEDDKTEKMISDLRDFYVAFGVKGKDGQIKRDICDQFRILWKLLPDQRFLQVWLNLEPKLEFVSVEDKDRRETLNRLYNFKDELILKALTSVVGGYTE